MVQVQNQSFQYNIIFKSHDGIQLNGIVGFPENSLKDLNTKTHFKLALIVHGLLNHKESTLVSKLSNSLELYNWATLRLDMRGCGSSEGKATYSDYPDWVNDLKHVILNLQNEAFMIEDQTLKVKSGNNRSRLIHNEKGLINFCPQLLLGHSKGGSVALLSSIEPNATTLPYVINISGRVDLRHKSLHRFSKDKLDKLNSEGEVIWAKDQFQREHYLLLEDFKWRDKFEVEEYKKLKDNNKLKRILTLHGIQDQVVPHEDSLLLKNILLDDDRFQFEILDDCDHFFKNEIMFKVLNQKVITFLKEIETFNSNL